MKSCLNELRVQLHDGAVLSAPEEMAAYCLDYRQRFVGEALAVLQPNSTAEVQTIVRWAQRAGVRITPQGGNTSLCGGATPSADKAERPAVVLSMNKLNRLRGLSLVDGCMTVEAGMVLKTAQETAAAAGRYFPLSLASEGSCQIGGNIACNAGGLNVVRYGTMRDLVMGLEVVLPDGTLIDHLTPLHKNTTGLDLKQLFIGSEGTLGIITAATLKLFAQSKTTVTAWVGLPDIDAACALLSLLKGEFAERVSSFELLSARALQLSCAFTGLKSPMTAPWHILLELTDSMILPQLGESLLTVLMQAGYEEVVLAQTEQQRRQLWQLRESVSEAQRDLGASIKHDIALPISSVAAFIHQNMPKVAALYEDASLVVFGHLGDGSLHYNVFLSQTLGAEVYASEAVINATVYADVLAFNGTIAAEHGIGQLKKEWLKSQLREEELSLFKHLKYGIDKGLLFNNGKVVDI
ncbi:MAG: FAD-binding oxidoreductase [Neisseriaceae bacterium]|nr:FAD-binding oxidoreductase [Neisseriaceae bacterium]MBP6862812.1 FAD-binding oxidoreductase [Neisseriaceae bacterium]